MTLFGKSTLFFPFIFWNIIPFVPVDKLTDVDSIVSDDKEVPDEDEEEVEEEEEDKDEDEDEEVEMEEEKV